MNSPTPVTYLFYGQDEPTLRERLAAFCAEIGDPATADLNTIRFDGETVQLAEIASAAGTLPFLAERRLVLVENLTDSANGRALLDGLPDLLASLPDWSRLIFVETGLQDESPTDAPAERKRKASRRQALRQLSNIVENDPRGKVMAFEPPRDAVRWVMERAARHNAAIEPRAAQQLLDRIGDDLTLVDTELAKLAAATAGERPITVSDVALLTPYSPEANVFHMIDALGQRQGEVALRLFRQLLDAGDEPLRIFSLIVRHFRYLLIVKEQLDGGQSVGHIVQLLAPKVREFAVKKMAEQSRHYSLALLERIYRHLLEVDLAIKTGKVAPDVALEILIVRLAGRG